MGGIIEFTEGQILATLEMGTKEEKGELFIDMTAGAFPKSEPVIRGIFKELEGMDFDLDEDAFWAIQDILKFFPNDIAVPVYLDYFKHEDETAASAAILAAGRTGDEKAFMHLILMIETEEFAHRNEDMVEALGNLGIPLATEALLSLAHITIRPDSYIYALGLTGDRSVISPLFEMLRNAMNQNRSLWKDDSKQVFQLAVQAIGNIGSPSAVPALRVVRSQLEKRYASRQIESELACIDRALKKCKLGLSKRDLDRAMEDLQSRNAPQIARALEEVNEKGMYQSPQIVEAVMHALRDFKEIGGYPKDEKLELASPSNDPTELWGALSDALTNVTNPRAVPALREALDRKWASSDCAIWPLGQIRSQDALEVLRGILAGPIDSDEDLLKISFVAQGMIRFGIEELKPELTDTMKRIAGVPPDKELAADVYAHLLDAMDIGDTDRLKDEKGVMLEPKIKPPKVAERQQKKRPVGGRRNGRR